MVRARPRRRARICGASCSILRRHIEHEDKEEDEKHLGDRHAPESLSMGQGASTGMPGRLLRAAKGSGVDFVTNTSTIIDDIIRHEIDSRPRGAIDPLARWSLKVPRYRFPDEAGS